MPDLAIHWFRQDLRLGDNPALTEAARHGAVLPVYVLDDVSAGPHAMGGASRWWLHRSLERLNASLGGRLHVVTGNARECLPALAEQVGARLVTWNRCYEPWRVTRDSLLKRELHERGIEVRSSNASLLWEPWDVSKPDGTPYRVFTPYFRRGCLNAIPPRNPLPAPELELVRDLPPTEVAELGLLPPTPWHESLEPHWQPGESGARERLAQFLGSGLADYREGRNFPDRESVSRLSPHLHFGELSPNVAWHASLDREEQAVSDAPDGNADHFRSELGWREFSYSMLYHFPQLPEANLQPKFDAFPWRADESTLRAWQNGRTGIPIVDAGMRELWQTGYMHNRVRMIVASFLVKNLGIDWRCGARWFWDTLVDADLANNSASWQWVAGCGAEAAPYFRIFNPVTQGRKFDPDGRYIRRWIPELRGCPPRHLYSPWTAPGEELAAADIVLGETYPAPMVDLKGSREAALAAFRSLAV
ncbi:MAG: deoxyribodipyrimidine photolyase [Gammaproteobacteria bacterium]|nr:deoxyribodipyrimidine photolyase [Gammaproteobacteria bacterium]